MFDIDVQEERKNQKAQMQQRFKEQMQQRKKTASPSSNDSVDWKMKYEQEKKKRKVLQKNIRQKERIITRKDEKARHQFHAFDEEKRKRAMTAKKLGRAYADHKEMNAALTDKQKEIDRLQDELKQLQAQLELSENKSKAYNIQYFKKKYEEAVRQAQQIRKQNEQLSREQKKLHYQIKINQTIRLSEKDGKKEWENKRLRQRNRILTEHLEHYQRAQEPADLLKILQDLITEQNIPHFFDERQNKLEQLAKKANEMKWNQRAKKRRKPPQRFQELKENDPFVYFGYIAKKVETWYFFDAQSLGEEDALIFPVIGNTTGKTFEQDAPVKAYLREDGHVMVVEVYDYETAPAAVTIKIKEKQSKTEKEKIVYPSFGNAHVLLIGSRQLNHYRQRLEKHGLQVTLHNPFEESYHRIKGKVTSSDVVIVCTSHISHSVMDHIDKKDPKVELIERDNEEWVTARVRFALIQKGLLAPYQPEELDEADSEIS